MDVGQDGLAERWRFLCGRTSSARLGFMRKEKVAKGTELLVK